MITCDTATTTASGTGTLATRVRTLTDIIGMNIHIGSRAAGYTNDTTLLADLAYMGVYNVRDHLELNGSGSADTFALLATLGNNGIKLLLSAPPDADGGNLVVADTVTAAAAMINAIPAGMLIAIEGPNEPDNFQYSYNGVKQTINGAAQQLPGFLPIAQYSAALYTAIRANSTTAHLPIVGVSDQGFETDNSGMQFLTIPTGYNHNTLTTNASTARGSKVLHFASVPLTGSAAVQAGHFIYVAGVTSGTTVSSATGTTVTMSANATAVVGSGASVRFGARMPDGTVFSDTINIHTYPWGAGPQTPQQSVQSVDPTHGNYFINDIQSLYVKTWLGGYSGYTLPQALTLPIWCTEYGYDTTPETNGLQVIPDVAGKNNLTAWLNAWKTGLSKLYIYEVYDDPAGPWFGMFTTPGNPKLGATYFHNFTTIIADIGATAATFTPTRLSVSFTNLPATAQWGLLQSSARTFFLLVWNNVVNGNIGSSTPVTVPPTTVTVTFGQSGTIKTFDPIVGTAAQSTTTGLSTSISLTDHVLVITLDTRG